MYVSTDHYGIKIGNIVYLIDHIENIGDIQQILKGILISGISKFSKIYEMYTSIFLFLITSYHHKME